METKNCSSFFANTACEYYPCHKGEHALNCLFCYCPFFLEEDCPGDPVWLGVRGNCIKDCSACTFPHKSENYAVIINWLIEQNAKRKYSEEVWAKAYPEDVAV